jgi:glycosyltransferase involved in cell wall biosynthesis
MRSILFTQTGNVELLVENGNPMGGAVVETLIWMKAMHQLGYKIIQLRDIGDQRPIKSEFDWIYIQPNYDPSKGIKWFRWVFYRLPKAFKQIKSAQADYLYESIPNWNTFFIALMCRRLRVKLILRIASDKMLEEKTLLSSFNFKNKLVYMSFDRCDFILPQNKFQYNRLKELIPNKKIQLLHNPFEIDKDYLKIKNSKKGYISWVANFRYAKNLKMLFEIAQILPHNLFKIAGSSLPNLDEETKLYLTQLKTLKNIEFVGTIKREEILDFFSQSMFLLNTSRYEGFSNTFLEAMATGTPILTTRAVNPDGIIDKFNLGLIYESPEQLKKILEGINDSEYYEISSRCIQYISKNHDHLEIGKKLNKVIQEI